MKILPTVLLMIFGFASSALFGEEKTKVVFLTGDDEYRSEESQPMLAKMLERDYGFETVVGFSVNEEGFVLPSEESSVTKIEELEEADLLVLFLRFRRPSPEQFQYFLDYIASGKPIIAFRTATHAFRFAHDAGMNEWGYQNDPKKIHSLAGGEKIRDLLGQSWVTHHGHFDDGNKPLTEVMIHEGASAHPVLTGVEPFPAYSWLYHVDGGEHSLAGSPEILLDGRALQSSKIERKQTDLYPLTNPVAWTKNYEVSEGNVGRVFTTTLGHPYDFKNENMRRLAIQGMLWALGREDLIPEEGVATDPVEEFAPNNSGFEKTDFKQGMRPSDFTGKD